MLLLCSACIDQRDSIDDCENQIRKFVKPWKYEELTPLPPFGNVTDKEVDNEVVVIENDYDHVSDMVREVMYLLSLQQKIIKKKCIIIYYDALCLNPRCCKSIMIHQIIHTQSVQWC